MKQVINHFLFLFFIFYYVGKRCFIIDFVRLLESATSQLLIKSPAFFHYFILIMSTENQLSITVREGIIVPSTVTVPAGKANDETVVSILFWINTSLSIMALRGPRRLFFDSLRSKILIKDCAKNLYYHFRKYQKISVLKSPHMKLATFHVIIYVN
ncbi:hypothetical protein EDC94DRAFT_377257 [Helicostylum pulchrum]|nr:hypothetical protein EDC94DRAFT_377257 [Helicostylum pulchrum]